jgi:hypothetical protein
MKLYEILKNFVHKARQEAAREYSVSAVAEKSDSPKSDAAKSDAAKSDAAKSDAASGIGGKAAAKRGWIGIDLDGTLAYMDPMSGTSIIGPPVPRMLELARKLMRDGYRIKIFTARASDSQQIGMILKWLRENGLPELEITNMKDYEMIRLYDDRAVQVIANTGKLVEPSPNQ